MDFEDYLQPEVGIIAAVTATLFSPRVRRLLRRGVVYSTAGVLMAGDAATSFARNIGRGAQRARETFSTSAKQTTAQETTSGG